MLEFFYEIFLRPWSSLWYIGNTLDRAVLLLLASQGILLSFRAGAFNLGAEAQIYAGGVFSTLILLSPLPAPLIFFLAPLSALFIGALLGTGTAQLKVKSGADPMITSFLISLIITPFLDALIRGPLRDTSKDLIASARIPNKYLLSRLLPPSSLNTGLFIALSLLILLHLFLQRSRVGLALKVMGTEENFARYLGMDSQKHLVPALSIGAAMLSLSGYLFVAGTAGICHLGFPAGLGWNAIAVALIARNKPLALIPAALFFAWMEAGLEAATLSSFLIPGTRGFLVAGVFFFVTIQIKKPWRRRKRI